jgi:type I restriction enzyme S subunit
VVQHIEPHHIADIPVPIPPGEFQEKIHLLVQGAADARSEARRLLDSASAYFDRLGSPPMSSHDHAFAAGAVRRSRLSQRLDAFYHVGWAAEAQVDGDPLASFAEVALPGRAKLIPAERGVPFLTGVDVYQVRPAATKRIARHLSGLKELMSTPGSVLLQVDGQRYGLLGRPAYSGARLEGAAVSWHLARVHSSQAPRVFAFVRSETGRRAIVRNSYGTSVPAISASQLERVRVPELPAEFETGARRALCLQEQADADEEQAIREVEAWLS